MQLGAFSVSLAVKDIAASKAFYEKLGFTATGGGDRWQIMVSGSTVIGLFQGMLEANILTFNPGWGQDVKPRPELTVIRQIEARLEEAGVPTRDSTTAKSESGPASFVVVDPDGNAILFDQHV